MISSDSRFVASIGDDKVVQIWDSHSDSHQQYGRAATSIAISSDGANLATSTDQVVQLWERESNRDLLRMTSPSPVCGMVFSPDSKRLVVAGGTPFDSCLTLWDTSSGMMLLTLRGCASFSADGQILSTAGSDGMVKIWNAGS